jgi:NADH-quinone oxidoreductase subunit A
MTATLPLPLTLANGLATYGPLVVLIFMALAFGLGNLLLTRLLGPRRTGQRKGTTYESGMDPVGSARKRFNVRFYIVAMTFLVFDVEIVFLYPWATVFSDLGSNHPMAMQYLARMLFFVATSIIAYLYAWRKGVFNYD